MTSPLLCFTAFAVTVILYVDAASITERDGSVDLFPKHIFYINMDSQSERANHMQVALSGYPGHVERVSAISADEVPRFSSYLKEQGLSRKLARQVAWTAGANHEALATIGCWLSHVTLWERLEAELTEHDATALILEDDVVFPPQGWEAQLRKVLSDAPATWSVLRVCGFGESRPKDALNARWALARWPAYSGGKWHYGGTCGYLVQGSELPALLQHVRSQPIKDIDFAMMLPEVGKSVAADTYTILEATDGSRVFTHTGHAANSIHSASNIPSNTSEFYNGKHAVFELKPEYVRGSVGGPTVGQALYALGGTLLCASLGALLF